MECVWSSFWCYVDNKIVTILEPCLLAVRNRGRPNDADNLHFAELGVRGKYSLNFLQIQGFRLAEAATPRGSVERKTRSRAAGAAVSAESKSLNL